MAEVQQNRQRRHGFITVDIDKDVFVFHMRAFEVVEEKQSQQMSVKLVMVTSMAKAVFLFDDHPMQLRSCVDWQDVSSH